MLEKKAGAPDPVPPQHQPQQEMHAQYLKMHTMIQSSPWQQLSQLQAQIKGKGSWPVPANASASASAAIDTRPSSHQSFVGHSRVSYATNNNRLPWSKSGL